MRPLKRSKQQKAEQVPDEPKDPKRSLLEIFSVPLVFKAMIGVLRLRAFCVLEVK